MRRRADGSKLRREVSELLLSVFAGGESAAGAMRDLQAGRLARDSFASAATVSIAEDGTYTIETVGRPGAGRGVPGLFWDALFGLILAVPVPGTSYGPSAGALLGALIEAGVDEQFLERSRRALVPGTSAVALLLSGDDHDEDLWPLRGHGVTLILTSLAPEQEADLEREFGGAAWATPTPTRRRRSSRPHVTTGHPRRRSEMAIGPVQLIVLGFQHPDFHGEIIAELERLRESDTVRVIDALAVHKDADGEIEVAHLSNLTKDEAIELGTKIGALIGLGIEGEEGMQAGALAGAEAAEDGVQVFDDEDAWDVLDEIPNDSAAALLLIEHHWAVPLRDAVARAGGFRISDGFISPLDLIELGLVSAQEAEELHALEQSAASN